MNPHPTAIAVSRLAAAILNGSARVQDAGPETVISGTDGAGVEFDFVCQTDGTITCENDED